MSEIHENAPATGDAGRRGLSRSNGHRAPGPDHGVLEMLTSVLAGLAFPARPWQIIAAAESYGSDAQTMTRLHQLPPATYPSLQHVAHAYSNATGPRRTGSSPPGPPPPR
ncbi:DUF2795 domain-containing protein [Actinomycetospora sp.]|uniref:DUF2795 domain-containing protein n=1 Tax=Actinomycetospora sp. TaxID=1872135 RepID=UPI002F41F3FF